MDTQLTGKRALVTGAASGMGKAIAEAFAKEGAIVAVHARSAERAVETIASITEAGGKCVAVAADLRETGQIEAMCAEAVDKLGGMDIVVNNAGVADFAPVVEMDEELWDWHFDVNLKAPFLVSKYTLPAIIEQDKGGSMIYIASTNAKTADAKWTAYNATKHGLVGFARCLAAEVGGKGIRVNAICPGWIETKMAVELHHKFIEKDDWAMGRPYDDVWDESMAGTNMLHTIAQPADVADFAVYLASEKGRFVHGQAINVCGGLCYW